MLAVVTEVCTWFDERPSVVVCRSEHRPATGPPVRGVSLLGYDESTQRYTYYHYNNRGLTRSQIGWWVDGEFRFVGERLIGGRAVREQVRIRRSDKGMTFEEQRSVEGGPWTPRASFEYLRLR